MEKKKKKEKEKKKEKKQRQIVKFLSRIFEIALNLDCSSYQYYTYESLLEKLYIFFKKITIRMHTQNS